MRVLVLTGSGDYADPWHPYADTSATIGALLESAGHEVEHSDDIDGRLAAGTDVDLLIVNAGDPWRDQRGRTAPETALAGLASALAAGTGLLAFHAAVATMRDYPEWAEATGAIWMPHLSYHPDASLTRIRVDHEALPGLPDDFEVFDERYCRLQPVGRSQVVAWHDGDGRPEPAAWIREGPRSRVAVDVLGHDARSYESEGHRALVLRLAAWAGS